MENWQKRSLDLVAGLAKSNGKNPSVIPYTPQKLRISGMEHRYFKRTAPERHGVSSRRLISMLTELEAQELANIHNLIVVKDGAVICECSQPGYDINVWHLSHSMSKTVTGMAIGLLVDDGLLDVNRTLAQIFPEVKYKDRRFKNITVEHLLCMTSGVVFAEVGSVTETKWLDAFFASALLFEPGTDFAYNSMNSYVLARIVNRITGKRVVDFVGERIFKPLHITNYFWELSHEGFEKGGWGLYLSIESWAKLGQMMLDGGRFDGVRVLSSDWVRRMTATHGIPNERSGDFNYGYHLWVNRNNDEFLFNGMLGQNVWVCPLNNVIVAINAGNNELFQNSPAMGIIRRYLGYAFDDSLELRHHKGLAKVCREFFVGRHWTKPHEPRKTLAALLGFRKRRPFDEVWDPLLGKKFGFRTNHVGMLPLFVRCMQNNMNTALEYIRFDRLGDSLLLTFREGGRDYRVEVGIYEIKYTVLDFRGERYMVGVMGEAMEDEERNPYYKVELTFPELPNTRRIRISLVDGERILVRFSEVPDNRIAQSLIETYPVSNPKLGTAISLLEARVGDNFISSRLEAVFTPSFIAVDLASRNHRAILAEEERRAEETSAVMKAINSIIEKMTRELDEEVPVGAEPSSAAGRVKTVIGDIVEKLKKRRRKADAPLVPSGDVLIAEVKEALDETEGKNKR